MKFTSKQYALTLFQVISETHPKDHDLVLNNFLSVLTTNQDLDHWEVIVKEVESLFQQQENTSKIEITTATDKAFNKKIVSELNQFAKVKSEVSNKVDPDILGGVIIRVDDTLIDASLKTKLENLREDLKQ